MKKQSFDIHFSFKCFFFFSFIYIIGCHATPSGDGKIAVPHALPAKSAHDKD